MNSATLKAAAALGLGLLLTGCAARQPRPVCDTAAAASAWRSIATEEDRRRLREWRSTWRQALAEAAGHGAGIGAQGALLQPDAALPAVAPPPGEYSCRTFKLGNRAVGRSLTYLAYPPSLCRIRIEENVLSFAKLDGPQRPIGLLFPESERRMIFLGTLQLSDERRALQYGRDRERDMAGMLERVGERRWRLVFPRPQFESTLDVIELVPR